MKQVSISLNPEIARAYQQATDEERQKVNYIVNSWLKNIFYRKKDSKQKLFETMDQIGRIAEANGLTPEILNEILNQIEHEKH
ncbi:MAG: hypothetical protein WC868_05735 [Bacteroidales bacterium]